MLLLIDNYDSFTYNLFQYLSELGAEVEVIRNDKATVAELAELKPERVVVSPGPSTPDNAGISVDVIKHFAGKVPVLGVCPEPSDSTAVGPPALGFEFSDQLDCAYFRRSRQRPDREACLERVDAVVPFSQSSFHPRCRVSKGPVKRRPALA